MNENKLATRIFLILHDPFTGKPKVGASAIRCGVLGGELAQLIMERRLGMENDRIVLADPDPRDVDQISAFVLESFRNQTESHSVPSWVGAMAERFFELVAIRLIDTDVVHRLVGRGLRRGVARFPALDLLAAAGPRVRLEHMLRKPADLDTAGSVCAAVLGAIGGDRTLDPDGDRAAVRRQVTTITEELPVDLRTLVTGLEVAHASGALPPSLRLRATEG